MTCKCDAEWQSAVSCVPLSAPIRSGHWSGLLQLRPPLRTLACRGCPYADQTRPSWPCAPSSLFYLITFSSPCLCTFFATLAAHSPDTLSSTGSRRTPWGVLYCTGSTRNCLNLNGPLVEKLKAIWLLGSLWVCTAVKSGNQLCFHCSHSLEIVELVSYVECISFLSTWTSPTLDLSMPHDSFLRWPLSLLGDT